MRQVIMRGVGSIPVPPDSTRRLIQAVIDPSIAAATVVMAMWLRYEADIPDHSLRALLWLVPLMAFAQLAAGWSQGLYMGRWRFGGLEEVFALVRASGLTTFALVVINVPLSPRPIPLSACVAQGLLTILFCASVRWSWRMVQERSMRPAGSDLTRVVVVGAGEAGLQLIGSMMRNREGRFLPVALADDDPAKRNLRVQGVPVLGSAHDVCSIAGQVEATTVVLAIPSAEGAVIRELSSLAAGCGLEVMVLPPVNELLGPVDASDVRPLTEADLLGRRQIDTDLDSIAGYVTGRRLLVTGAGGSIGSELCRQLHRFAPAELVMLDRDESALHAVQLSIEGRALLDDRSLVVADIRDRERLAEVFEEHRPEVVFHAAALKHLPLLEMHPVEAFKSNVEGTQNMLEVAGAHCVDHFVNISTDKAADPTSVLGSSKRLAERLTAAAATTNRGAFVSVRFGNVLGSRGSVLTTFRAQIAAGGPVTVTDRDVTRYFMTVEEAVQLVIQAGAVGGHGDALVLDMGAPVRIDDVARRLIEQHEPSGRVEISYTGLRPGEKLHEALFSSGEVARPTDHPLISSVPVAPAPDTMLDTLRAVAGRDMGPAMHRLAEPVTTSPA